MGELIRHFGIDWKLLLAQAVNFFILLVLLRKFAYRPILDMLRKRKAEIERGLKMRKEAEEGLQKIDALREATLEKARQEALLVVTKAEGTAKTIKAEIVTEANKKVEGMVEEAKRLVEQEKAKMGEEVYQNSQELVRLAVEKVLGKIPPKIRDQELIQEALRELKTLRP